MRNPRRRWCCCCWRIGRTMTTFDPIDGPEGGFHFPSRALAVEPKARRRLRLSAGRGAMKMLKSSSGWFKVADSKKMMTRSKKYVLVCGLCRLIFVCVHCVVQERYLFLLVLFQGELAEPPVGYYTTVPVHSMYTCLRASRI